MESKEEHSNCDVIQIDEPCDSDIEHIEDCPTEVISLCSEDEEDFKSKIKLENHVSREGSKRRKLTSFDEVIVLPLNSKGHQLKDNDHVKCGIKQESKIMIKKEEPICYMSPKIEFNRDVSASSENLVSIEVKDKSHQFKDKKDFKKENNVVVKTEETFSSSTAPVSTILSSSKDNYYIKSELQIKKENIHSSEFPATTLSEQATEGDIKVKFEVGFKTEDSIGNGSVKTEISENTHAGRKAEIRAPLVSIGTQTDDGLVSNPIDISPNLSARFPHPLPITSMVKESPIESVVPVDHRAHLFDLVSKNMDLIQSGFPSLYWVDLIEHIQQNWGLGNRIYNHPSDGKKFRVQCYMGGAIRMRRDDGSKFLLLTGAKVKRVWFRRRNRQG